MEQKIADKPNAFFEALGKFRKFLREQNVENMSIYGFISDYYLKKAIGFYLKCTEKLETLDEKALQNTKNILEEKFKNWYIKRLKNLEGVFAIAILVYLSELAKGEKK